MEPDQPPSVDRVREELRRLGYLDTGLDRFVLGRPQSASAFRASLAVARRIGLAGGALFGAVLLFAAVLVDPRLLAEPQDLVVLFLYLAVVAAVGLAGLALLGGTALGLVARRLGRRPGPNVARNAGVVLAAVALTYLGFWWHSHAQTAAVPVQAALLASGLGLGFLFARFGTLAAVAVLSAVGAGDVPEARASRHHLMRLVAAALALLVGGVLAVSRLAAGTEVPAADFAVVPSGVRVRVLGIDGLQAAMAEKLMAEGEMPHLAALRGKAAWMPLRPEPEQVPAIVWTTIATGRGPAAHGIQSAGARRLAGMKTAVALGGEGVFASALTSATDLLRITRTQPPTAVLRSVKAFWNVASEKGLRVGVVNWWATWPADPVNGYLVSDRTFFKMEHGEPPDREVHPTAAFDVLRAALPAGEPHRARRLDAFYAEAARRLRADAPPDVEALYLPGLDIVTSQEMDETGADLASLDTRLAAVRRHYRFVDELVGAWARDAVPTEVLVLVGDPGRFLRSTSSGGVVAMIGDPIVAGERGPIGALDIAPTLLHLAGLPVSEELEGRVLESALSPDFRKAHPIRTVPSYGRRVPDTTSRSAFDREMVDELRALGYVQ